MVAITGQLIPATEFNNAKNRVLAILGNGSGQLGYGQIVASAEDYAISTNDELISANHWNALTLDVNKCLNHQQPQNAQTTAATTGRVMGANSDGVSSNNGINDMVNDINTAETLANAALVHSTAYTLTSGRSFLVSQRTSAWGGDGDPDDLIYCDLDVDFPGGYATTNSSGNRINSNPEDHRRHFFNAGGQVRLSFASTNLSTKDQNWATMLAGAGTVVFNKFKTTVTGSGLARDGLTDVDGGGIDSALGNYQLTTSFQTIFRKYGSSVYAANYIQVQAKRVGVGLVRFRVSFYDAAEGNPNFDERVLLGAGSLMQAGIDLRRATGSFVSVPTPNGSVSTELVNT